MMNQLSRRQSTARLRLINPDGTPASGQHVKADQISHKFLFGCGAFDSVEMMRTHDKEKKAFLQERMNKWLQLFNYGTLPFYWGRYEPEEGKTAYPETIAAAKWLREKGVRAGEGPSALLTYGLRTVADTVFQRGDSSAADRTDPSGRRGFQRGYQPVGRDQRSGDHAGI